MYSVFTVGGLIFFTFKICGNNPACEDRFYGDIDLRSQLMDFFADAIS